MASRIVGIMLFGSVPRPPKKPKSWTSTHTARQNTPSSDERGADQPLAPARRRDPARAGDGQGDERAAGHGQHQHGHQVHGEAVGRDERAEVRRPGAPARAGCEVLAMRLTIEVSEPGWPCSVPCQNPRPGQACSTAIPARNTPMPPTSSRGQATGCASTGRAARSARRPRRRGPPRRARRSASSGRGPGSPPSDSPNTHTTSAPGERWPARPAGTGRRARRTAATGRCRPGSRPPTRRPGPGGRTRPSRPS